MKYEIAFKFKNGRIRTETAEIHCADPIVNIESYIKEVVNRDDDYVNANVYEVSEVPFMTYNRELPPQKPPQKPQSQHDYELHITHMRVIMLLENDGNYVSIPHIFNRYTRNYDTRASAESVMHAIDYLFKNGFIIDAAAPFYTQGNSNMYKLTLKGLTFKSFLANGFDQRPLLPK